MYATTKEANRKSNFNKQSDITIRPDNGMDKVGTRDKTN